LGQKCTIRNGKIEWPQKSRPPNNEVTVQEMIVFSLAKTDAFTKLLIEKGLITQAEFMQKLPAKRTGYQEMLGKMS